MNSTSRGPMTGQSVSPPLAGPDVAAKIVLVHVRTASGTALWEQELGKLEESFRGGLTVRPRVDINSFFPLRDIIVAKGHALFRLRASVRAWPLSILGGNARSSRHISVAKMRVAAR